MSTYHSERTYVIDVSTDARMVIARQLADALPHGSGINGQWYITDTMRGTFRASNTYEAMNENGFYCHDYCFTCLITYDKLTGKFDLRRVMMSDREHACCGYDLRSYLEDDISQCLAM